MRLSRKGGKRLSQGQEKFALRIAGRILAFQRLLADWLNVRTASVSPKAWLFLLVCFCAGFGAYLLHLVMQVFY